MLVKELQSVNLPAYIPDHLQLDSIRASPMLKSITVVYMPVGYTTDDDTTIHDIENAGVSS